MDPLQKQIEEIKTNKLNKEQQLKDAQSKLEQLNKDNNWKQLNYNRYGRK